MVNHFHVLAPPRERNRRFLARFSYHMATFSSRRGRPSNDLYLPRQNAGGCAGEKEIGTRRLISVSLSSVVRANRARLFSNPLRRIISSTHYCALSRPTAPILNHLRLSINVAHGIGYLKPFLRDSRGYYGYSTNRKKLYKHVRWKLIGSYR